MGELASGLMGLFIVGFVLLVCFYPWIALGGIWAASKRTAKAAELQSKILEAIRLQGRGL